MAAATAAGTAIGAQATAACAGIEARYTASTARIQADYAAAGARVQADVTALRAQAAADTAALGAQVEVIRAGAQAHYAASVARVHQDAAAVGRNVRRQVTTSRDATLAGLGRIRTVIHPYEQMVRAVAQRGLEVGRIAPVAQHMTTGASVGLLTGGFLGGVAGAANGYLAGTAQNFMTPDLDAAADGVVDDAPTIDGARLIGSTLTGVATGAVAAGPIGTAFGAAGGFVAGSIGQYSALENRVRYEMRHPERSCYQRLSNCCGNRARRPAGVVAPVPGGIMAAATSGQAEAPAPRGRRLHAATVTGARRQAVERAAAQANDDIDVRPAALRAHGAAPQALAAAGTGLPLAAHADGGAPAAGVDVADVFGAMNPEGLAQ